MISEEFRKYNLNKSDAKGQNMTVQGSRKIRHEITVNYSVTLYNLMIETFLMD